METLNLDLQEVFKQSPTQPPHKNMSPQEGPNDSWHCSGNSYFRGSNTMFALFAVFRLILGSSCATNPNPPVLSCFCVSVSTEFPLLRWHGRGDCGAGRGLFCQRGGWSGFPSFGLDSFEDQFSYKQQTIMFVLPIGCKLWATTNQSAPCLLFQVPFHVDTLSLGALIANFPPFEANTSHLPL